MSIWELKQLVLDNFDPDDVLEALNLSTEDLVNAFEDKLEQNSYKFIDEDKDEENELEL